MKKDIFQVLIGTAIMSVIMDVVFLAIGKFDLAVVLGTLLGIACAGLNFVFLAFSVSKSLGKGKAAIGYMGTSYLLRLAFIGIVVIFAIKSPYVNYVAVVIPLLFPRIIITLLQGLMKQKSKTDKGGDSVGRT